MRGDDLYSAEMTSVARTNVNTFVRALNSLTAVRAGAQVGGWFTDARHGATVDFRIPYADFKHPSSVEINREAESPTTVFKTGKYQAVRFDSLGERSAPIGRLREQYGDWESSDDDLTEQYHNEVQQRTYAFESAIEQVLSRYSGISGRVDTGDASFSAGHHRPHIRLYSLNCDGATLGRFVSDCVDAVGAQVYQPSKGYPW